MFEVQYRCVYREFWYQGPEFYNLNSAAIAARQIAMQRRTPTRVVYNGEIVWATGPIGAVGW